MPDDDCGGDRSIGSCFILRMRKSPQPNVNPRTGHGLAIFGHGFTSWGGAVVAAAVAAMLESNCRPLVSGAAAVDFVLTSGCFSAGIETTNGTNDDGVDDDALCIDRSVG